MRTKPISLLAYDFYAKLFLEYNVTEIPSDFNKLEFYMPDSVKGSSIEEFYLESMELFNNTIKQIEEYSKIGNTILVRSLMPMATLLEAPAVSLPSNASNYVQANNNVLPEIVSFCEEGAFTTTFKELTSFVEGVSAQLLAKYPAKKMDKVVTPVNLQTDLLDDQLIAAMLYSWSCMPFNQLQLLATTLNEDTKIYLTILHLKKVMPAVFNLGNRYSFDIHADFVTQLNMRHLLEDYSYLSQAKTPFNKFPEYLDELIRKLPTELSNLVAACIGRSRMLYSEMLKTGLGYEAQYATLSGFPNRLIINANTLQWLDFLKSAEDLTNLDTIRNIIGDKVINSCSLFGHL